MGCAISRDDGILRKIRFFFDGQRVIVSHGDTSIGSKKLFSCTKSSIEDTIIWLSNIASMLAYFVCVFDVCFKNTALVFDKINTTS